VYLKRVTVTGFKSFASKTVLDLEPGITAVVGPNGSGKSNLADAVRWALGEQSKGRLRLGDREDVVFAGSDKRPRASLAEVTLLFNNEDGAFPLDLTEVEISRRLYRSGETDYRLAGRSVRLSDIQTLLAQAGFGANTYAVIGQGMIDSFLLSSPSERKLLFDEAAGIRGPELKREGAVRKLAATSTNLVRLRDLAAELAPRLAHLEQAMQAAEVQRDLEGQVNRLRSACTEAALAHWSAARAAAAHRLETAAASTKATATERLALDRRLADLEAAEAKAAAERERLQHALADLEQNRDHLALELADRHAAVAESERLAISAQELTARFAAARTEVSSARDRLSELESELSANAQAAARADRTVDQATRAVASAQSDLVAIRRGTADGTRDQYVDHALQLLKTLALGLNSGKATMEDVRLHIHKAGRLLSHATRTGASELLAQLKNAQTHLEAAMAKRETAVEHQTNLTITRRSLEIDLAHQQETVERAQALASNLEQELKPARAAASQAPALEHAATEAAEALATATRQLEARREHLVDLTSQSGTAGDRPALAAAAERLKATQAEAESSQASAVQELAAAEAALAAAGARARDWGLPTADLEPKSKPQFSAESLADLESQLIRAEAQLEAHIAARADQATELESLGSRRSELSTQIADLEVAQADLESVVAELDELIRARFKQNFARLAEQFSAYFTQLFGGGSASLELTEADDGTYGIVIKASPKGKRLTTVSAMSGGERAMAGVALLAAILRVNPSPFVVLDEIDAALDEANSGRLASILSELKDQSQLIVITHNRQTMHAARVLFGVTMNEHHISHLLSMRFEDASALAAR
jgi:chromosome segregation protein